MGYYSDVCIKCDKKAFDKIYEVAKRKNFLPDQLRTDGEFYYFNYSSRKWYDHNPDFTGVCGVMSALHEIDDNPDLGEYTYIRIGEDNNDNERMNSGDWDCNIWLERTVYIENEKDLIELNPSNLEPIPKSYDGNWILVSVSDREILSEVFPSYHEAANTLADEMHEVLGENLTDEMMQMIRQYDESSEDAFYDDDDDYGFEGNRAYVNWYVAKDDKNHDWVIIPAEKR